MTDAENKSISKELAARDLADIAALRKEPAFERYFLRRLKVKRAQLDETFRTDDKLTHEQREVHRKLVLEYDEILSMMAKDELGANAVNRGNC
jgi:hypothetical protein